MVRNWIIQVALAAAMECGWASVASAMATFVVVDNDGPNEGFNDPTPVAPVPGNPGTTLGEQRLNAFQAAANSWGQVLTSAVPIRITAQMDRLQCTPTAGLLGGAAPLNVFRDFPNAPRAATWFPSALANSLAGVDLDPANDDIGADFNSDVDSNPNCFRGHIWWYGIGAPAPKGTFSFFDVVLHELGHGLGFDTFVNLRTGAKLGGFDDIYMTFLEDDNLGLSWPAMTNHQRAASAIDGGKLHWIGTQVNTCAANILTAGIDGGYTRMYAPNPLQPASSVVHWAPALTPDQLMEPFATATVDRRLAERLLADIGWTVSSQGCGGTGVPIEVAVDIRPLQCPNRINVHQTGDLPVVIAGTESVDVRDIDVSSIRLAGVRPNPGRRFLDRVTPFAPFVGKAQATDCTREGSDGFEDLRLVFGNQKVGRALGPVADGQVVVVPLTGQLMDGTPIRGEDVVTVINKAAAQVAFRSEAGVAGGQEDSPEFSSELDDQP
jgi:hypothetical protein